MRKSRGNSVFGAPRSRTCSVFTRTVDKCCLSSHYGQEVAGVAQQTLDKRCKAILFCFTAPPPTFGRAETLWQLGLERRPIGVAQLAFSPGHAWWLGPAANFSCCAFPFASRAWRRSLGQLCSCAATVPCTRSAMLFGSECRRSSQARDVATALLAALPSAARKTWPFTATWTGCSLRRYAPAAAERVRG